eukprot:scaffold12312_cov248-Ochromonas_danica.AAC.10
MSSINNKSNENNRWKEKNREAYLSKWMTLIQGIDNRGTERRQSKRVTHFEQPRLRQTTGTH